MFLNGSRAVAWVESHPTIVNGVSKTVWSCTVTLGAKSKFYDNYPDQETAKIKAYHWVHVGILGRGLDQRKATKTKQNPKQ